MRKTFFCIDAHTCGNPVRVVAGRGPPLVGATMSEKRQDFLARYAWLRGETDPSWARHVDPNPRAFLKRGLRFDPTFLYPPYGPRARKLAKMM